MYNENQSANLLWRSQHFSFLFPPATHLNAVAPDWDFLVRRRRRAVRRIRRCSCRSSSSLSSHPPSPSSRRILPHRESYDIPFKFPDFCFLPSVSCTGISWDIPSKTSWFCFCLLSPALESYETFLLNFLILLLPSVDCTVILWDIPSKFPDFCFLPSVDCSGQCCGSGMIWSGSGSYFPGRSGSGSYPKK